MEPLYAELSLIASHGKFLGQIYLYYEVHCNRRAVRTESWDMKNKNTVILIRGYCNSVSTLKMKTPAVTEFLNSETS